MRDSRTIFRLVVVMLITLASSEAENGKRSINEDSDGDYEEQERRGIKYAVPVKLWKHKLKMFSKLFDLNHDKIISKDDMKIQQNVFINVYDLKGKRKKSFKQELSQFWSCITLNRLNEGLSKEEFVTHVTESLRENQVGMKQYLGKCIGSFFRTADFDENGFISISEFSAVLKAFDHGNKYLTDKKYNLICPDTKTKCPLQTVVEYFTELLAGNDGEKYDKFEQSYDDVGMSLEDLVD